MQFYSCDSHVVEGRAVFDGLAERFGEGAPTIKMEPGEGEFLYIAGQRRVAVGRFGIAGNTVGTPETNAKIAAGYDGVLGL